MSYFYADQHIGRNALRRVEIIDVDDGGSQQRAVVRGLSGEEFKMAYRGQYFGASGVPPVGSDGFALLVGGRPDQAILMGIEHKDHRPTGTKPGEKVIYNAHGEAISLVQQNIRYVSAKHTFEGDIEITGNITQTGSITSTGVHKASGHV